MSLYSSKFSNNKGTLLKLVMEILGKLKHLYDSSITVNYFSQFDEQAGSFEQES